MSYEACQTKDSSNSGNDGQSNTEQGDDNNSRKNSVSRNVDLQIHESLRALNMPLKKDHLPE